MRRDTAALMAALAADAGPVRRLGGPGRRVWGVLLVALVVLAGLVGARGARPDLAQRLGDPVFLGGMLAALATGVGGALAALALAAPDRSRGWIALPGLAALVWLGLVGVGCLGAWVPLLPGMVSAGELVNCALTVALAAAPLTLAMAWQVRRAVPLRAGLPLVAAALGAAGFSAAVLAAVHAIAASALILAWNIGLVGGLGLVHAAIAGRVRS
jgi:hypothetical protein